MLGLATFACTSETPIETITGAPSLPAAVQPSTVAAGSAITTLARHDGALVIGTMAGASKLESDTLTSLQLRADGAGPLTTGSIRAAADRDSDALLLADGGVFQTWSDALLVSPIGEAMAGQQLSAIAVDGASIWVAASDGVYQIADGQLKRWQVDDGANGAIALCATGDALLMASGSRLFELDTATALVQEISGDFGAVVAMASGNGRAYLATQQGLVVRDGGGNWSRYTLSDSSTPASVSAVSYDLALGPLATIDGTLLSLQSGAPVGLAATNGVHASALGSDDFGGVWLADGEQVQGYSVGRATTFAGDVRPILAAHCDSCHIAGSDGAPAIDMTSYETVSGYAASILDRLAAQEMPPSEPLDTTDYQIFSRWYRGGKQP